MLVNLGALSAVFSETVYCALYQLDSNWLCWYAGMSPNPSYLDRNIFFMHMGQFMLCQLTWWLAWLPWKTTGELQPMFCPYYRETQTKKKLKKILFQVLPTRMLLIVFSKYGGLSFLLCYCQSGFYNTCISFLETALAGITGVLYSRLP